MQSKQISGLKIAIKKCFPIEILQKKALVKE